jgi:DNA polymerase III delta prime subunit
VSEEAGTASSVSGEGEVAKSDEMSISFLPKLTDEYAVCATLSQHRTGQDHAVHAFAEGVFNAEVIAASDEKRKRPRAIFVFAGPPGVGKTFLAEQAAETLKLPFKKFEMTAFADELGLNVLIGFPPSFKDAKEGTLTGFVNENPHCVILFDEIEKANIKIIQLFLQILDAGNLHDAFTDSDVSFRDTIIIFTTNAAKQLTKATKGLRRGDFAPDHCHALERIKTPKPTAVLPAGNLLGLATGYPISSATEAHDSGAQLSPSNWNPQQALFNSTAFACRPNRWWQPLCYLTKAEGGRANRARAG